MGKRMCFAILFIFMSCKDSNDSSPSDLAEIKAREEGILLVAIDASRDQRVNLGELSDSLESMDILFRAGSLSESADILIKLEEYNLVHEHLYEDFSLDKSSAESFTPLLSIEPVAKQEQVYAGLSGPQLTFKEKVEWVISRQIDENQRKTLSLLSLRATDDGAQLFLGSETSSEASASPSYSLRGFGLHQLAKIASASTTFKDSNLIEASIGAGAWWGYKVDAWQLRHDSKNAALNSLALRFDQQGDLNYYRLDDSEFLTGLSFSLSATARAGVFDNSNSRIFSPWVFQRNFQYGVIIDVAEPRKTVEVSVLQRTPWNGKKKDTDFSAVVASLSGRYFGQGVRYTPEGKQEILDSHDAVVIEQEGEKLSLSGQIADYPDTKLTLEINREKSEQTHLIFGFAYGDFDGNKDEDLIQVFFTEDFNAFAYVICSDDQAKSCEKAASSENFEFSSFRLGFLQKDDASLKTASD